MVSAQMFRSDLSNNINSIVRKGYLAPGIRLREIYFEIYKIM